METSKKLIENLYDNLTEENIFDYKVQSLHLDFIELVISKMNDLGWNQKKLALELGTSESYISKIFSAEKILNLKTIVKIQKILDFNFQIVTTESDSTTCNNCIYKKRAEQASWTNMIDYIVYNQDDIKVA